MKLDKYNELLKFVMELSIDPCMCIFKDQRCYSCEAMELLDKLKVGMQLNE